MPDLLFELFSEEIPARMQARAAEDLKALVTGRLVDAGLVYEGAQAFATPRRLALSVHGLPARQPDLREEKKGPRVGAPDGAIAGFLKGAGLSDISQAKIERDPKKGDFYVALIEKPGRSTIEVLQEILPVTIRTFPWPKSMRWGARSAKPGALNWVRPLHAIVATFGLETEEPDIVPFEVDGISGGNVTYGHRFHAPGAIRVRRFEDYAAKLRDAKVVLDAAQRRDVILAEAKNLAFAQGLALVEDEGLLHEVAGLVEWPVVLMGSFDPSFLAIPEEIIRATIRANQKCFVLREEATGKLAPKFLLVSNIEATDGGAAIVAGNERVIRARLSDAKFFYETDLRTKLEDRLPKFEHIVFHEKLGTQAERIARIERLAAELAPVVGADVETVKRAARLAKADLLTEVVGEFPELQGLMGKYYALAQGEDARVAAACEDHYKPQGPNDRVPSDPVSIAVALADKIDTLVGFWAIDEKPTGSKDPYALRRAALGVIRILLDTLQKLDMSQTLETFVNVEFSLSQFTHVSDAGKLSYSLAVIDVAGKNIVREGFAIHNQEFFEEKRTLLWTAFKTSIVSGLISFFHERLKVQLREQGARHDLVDAVLAQGEGNDDLLLIVRRVEALGKFLETEDGKNLLAGVKRGANILSIEEKKDKTTYDTAPDAALLKLPEERALFAAVGAAREEGRAAIAKEDFAGAMTALAKLRPAVDAFFDKVKVNDDDAAVRANRLRLLAEIREATRGVADFSKIQG